MTQGFNGDGIIEILLGWFKYLTGSIVDGITGVTGNNVFKWISGSWKGILAFVLITGCALNIVVYVIRWRPHWWWFAKKRMLVDDSIFEDSKKDHGSKPRRKAPSTMVPRRTASAGKKNLFEPDNDKLFTTKKSTRK